MKKIIFFILLLTCFLFVPIQKTYAYTENKTNIAVTYSNEFKVTLTIASLPEASSYEIEKDMSFVVDAKISDYEGNIETLTYKWATNNSDIKIYDNNSASCRLIGENESSGIITCTVTDESGSSSQGFLSLKITPKKSTTADIIDSLMANKTVLLLVFGIVITLLWRASLKIYNFGVSHKSDFATVEDQKKFENEMREKNRSDKSDLQDSLLKIMLREINRETRPIKNIEEVINSVKNDKEILDYKMKMFDERLDEIRRLNENVKQLEAKINRLQYGDDNDTVRRSGK